MSKTAITIDGKSYEMRIAGIDEEESFVQYARQQFIATIRAGVAALPREDAIEILKAGFLRLPLIHKDSPETEAAKKTKDGLIRWLWILYGHNEAEGLSFDAFQKWAVSRGE